MGHNLPESLFRKACSKSLSFLRWQFTFYTTGSNVHDFLTKYWVGIPIFVEDCFLGFGESYRDRRRG
jgi:hypothetical protein